MRRGSVEAVLAGCRRMRLVRRIEVVDPQLEVERVMDAVGVLLRSHDEGSRRTSCFANPGMRSTRVESVAAGSPPNFRAMARSRASA